MKRRRKNKRIDKRIDKRIEIPDVSPGKHQPWYTIQQSYHNIGSFGGVKYLDIYNQDDRMVARLYDNGEISIADYVSDDDNFGQLRLDMSGVNFKGRLFQAARYVFLKTQRPISESIVKS